MNKFIWPLIFIMCLPAYSMEAPNELADDDEPAEAFFQESEQESPPSPLLCVIAPLVDYLWGRGQKDGNWLNDVTENKLDQLHASGFYMLDRVRVESAMADHIHRPDEKNGSCSSGPTSGYRAFCYMGEPDCDFDRFVADCPRTTVRRGVNPLGRDVVLAGGGGLTIAGLIFTPIIGGFSLIPAATVWAGGAIAACVTAAMPLVVGPGPDQLATYLNSKMQQWSAIYAGYEDEGPFLWRFEFAKNIEMGLPIIVLLVSGTIEMDYVMIIGSTPGHPWGYWVILNKYGKVGVISSEKLEYWMNSAEYASALTPSQYNAIIFRPRQPE